MALREQAFPFVFVESVRTFFLTFVCAISAWVFILWYRSPQANHLQHATQVLLTTFFVFALAALIVMEWLGYHRLALFSITGLCLSAIYTVAVIAAWRLIEVLYEWVDNKQFAAARKVHQIFGVKFNKRMHEISLIKFSANVTVLCLYVVVMLKSWSISPVFVDSIVDGLLNGFKFSGLKIIPSRIIFALLSFSIIFLIGRFVAATIAKKHRFKGEEETQIAISTITIYNFFAAAFLFAMLVTGVDFTGLAIIAGALSVGVGLGLQTIVNNFVSGLILLIEKPIKPGDRIVIGKTEGFVRKIRIRSTQITTSSKEDVIVPNADLITQQVTNYMFRDRNARVQCQVGVAYESDVHLVKKILLEVAAKHDDVVHEAPNEPVVLFIVCHS
jgi:small-conductance mechanosensitive channel